MKRAIFSLLTVFFGLLAVTSFGQTTAKNSYHFRAIGNSTLENAKMLMEEVRAQIDHAISFNYNPKSGEFSILSDQPIDMPNVFKTMEIKGYFLADTQAGNQENETGKSSKEFEADVARKWAEAKKSSSSSLPKMILTQAEYDQIPTEKRQQLQQRWEIIIQ